MKRYRPYVVGAVGGILAAVLLPLTGLVSFDASSDQWRVTDWFFSVAARQAVSLRSFDTPVPPLGDAAAMRRAAGHYEMVCAACHGSPAGPPDQFADDLVPAPPRLVEQMGKWRPDARIFWTVKHGIKHSAMPAWPTQMRDDEVWDMVGFLTTISTLSAADYADLAGTARQGCASCHGENGEGNGAAPRLDIQSPQYLASALVAFRHGTRQSGTMMAAASRLTDKEIAELSAYFGKLASVDAAAPEARGAGIARHGIPERDIAACDACHGTTARPGYPRLMGQNRDYLITQLELFNEHGAARGGPHADLMAKAIRVIPAMEEGPLAVEEIEALADHYGR